MNLACQLTPEQETLQSLRYQLLDLNNTLGEKEEELKSNQIRLSHFEKRYQQEVVSKYVILDELEAQTLELLARQEPTNLEAQFRAKQARSKAESSKASQSNYDHQPLELPIDWQSIPTANLKDFYRKIVKSIHPDLTTNEEERVVRNRLMIEVNQAYQQGDLIRLKTIWFSLIIYGQITFDSASMSDEEIAAELVELIRTIAQVKRRIQELMLQIYQLKNQPLYQLMERAITAQAEGRDLLAEMAAQIDEQIQEYQLHLSMDN